MTILGIPEVKKMLESAEFQSEGPVENYQHTHWRCHYEPVSGIINAERVCKNEYGSCFGIGLYARIYLSVDQTVEWDNNWTGISVADDLTDALNSYNTTTTTTPRPTKEEEYRAALETIAYPRRGTPEEGWTALQIGEYAQRVLEGEATPK